jgi:transcription antitermination protein NusB
MAGPRRRSREIALQIIHQMDVSGELTAVEALQRYFEHLAGQRGVDEDDDAGVPAPRLDRALVEDLVRGVYEHRAEIDQTLATLSKNWRLERMALVDRNIIRLALYELRWCEGVPVNVAINEAVELAKRFGTAEGAAFVNGLLDRAVTELEIRR